MDWDARVAELYRRAVTLRAYEPHWSAFVESIWNTAIPELFPTAEERVRLAMTPTYYQLGFLRDTLRSCGPRTPKATLSVLFIRVPAAVHSVLVREAVDRGYSLNEWCLRRLIHPLQE